MAIEGADGVEEEAQGSEERSTSHDSGGADGVEEEAQGVMEMGVATGRRAVPAAWRRRRSPGVGVEPRKGCGLT
ncbi:hypothetical protein GUJ93_ZPchr0006g40835 [Zizania palustris]|uniref:Uncharacterized protein n=1 Tax=Zizania palustris TaxID=103762 RepID=A0A8J5W4W0_ZIZPA|nr:hypothetical protein GUJ93_ZPchr0006g40835 [Zizania palustris]